MHQGTLPDGRKLWFSDYGGFGYVTPEELRAANPDCDIPISKAMWPPMPQVKDPWRIRLAKWIAGYDFNAD